MITVLNADITTLAVDAIVNAANKHMLGGGGVDGAIHRAAGPELLEACIAVPQVRPGVRCPTGEARITRTFGRLRAKYVIHTVGPIWDGGGYDEAVLLADCHRNALRLALEHDCESIAVPAISTGVYGYPIDLAARVAVDATRTFLAQSGATIAVTFACFGENAASAYRAAVNG